MFDALKLLGSVVQSRSTPSGSNRLNAALQQTGGAGPLQQVLSQLGASGGRAGGGGLGGGLGGLLGGLMGQGSGGQAGMPGAAPGQGGIGGILGRLATEAQRAMNSSSPHQEVARNNPAALGGLGALAGGLLGGGRGAVGGGLLAVLGSLAYAAMQGQSQAPGGGAGVGVPGGGQGAGPLGAAPLGAAPVGAGPVGAAPAVMAGLDDPASVQRKAVLVLRSMIHAAKADGQIDAREMERIFGRLDASGEDREARDFVLDEMRGPADPDAIARGVTSPLEAAEVYAAALMAIEADTPAERDYLTRLAGALRLQPQVVARIHGTLGVPT